MPYGWRNARHSLDRSCISERFEPAGTALLLHGRLFSSVRSPASPPAARAGAASTAVVPVRLKPAALPVVAGSVATLARLAGRMARVSARNRSADGHINPGGEDLFFGSHVLTSGRILAAQSILGVIIADFDRPPEQLF